VDVTAKSIPTMQLASKLAYDFHSKLWLVHAVPVARCKKAPA